MSEKGEKTKTTGLLHDNTSAMDDLIRGLVQGLLERGHDTHSIGGWVADVIDATADVEVI